MIRATTDYKEYKERMARKMPKPRMKQWWERLMERELDHFYE